MNDAPLSRWQQRSRAMRAESFSARTLDLGGVFDARRVREVFETWGALHVQHTGLTDAASVVEVMGALGFAPHEQFVEGGRTSAATQAKWAAPGLRRMDFYPPELYLLPNNEVQYQHASPQRVLFACTIAPHEGGRVFLHSARAVELELARTAPELLARMLAHGFAIETGFLSKTHPEKAENYFQSWQERFGTEDSAQALDLAKRDGEAWWREDTLMTRVTLPARREGALRFPRVALDAPSARNGWRRFPLGDGSVLSEAEEELVREAFLATREGTALARGDLVLFDNVRFGHSRESFSGEREVLVGMSRVPVPQTLAGPLSPTLSPGGGEGGRRWPTEKFGTRTFEGLDFGAINAEFTRYGAVHVRNTGLDALPDEVLRALRFGGDDAFPWGGMSSGRTTRRFISRELRATDDYPAHLWLLPHNEVLYQRNLPARLLFFSAHACDGRTFVHSAERFEAYLRANHGEPLLESLREHGFRIEMGFLDERHPEKARNTFRSWQDRFETHDRAEAEARCRASTHQFDACWWIEESHGCATLMTRIRVPAFHEGRLLFPRIALDGPALHNGYRRYPRGNGDEFSAEEISLLLAAFLATREGVHYGAGDLLLVDNLRYGHSREAFTGPRSIAVAMAGSVRIS